VGTQLCPNRKSRSHPYNQFRPRMWPILTSRKRQRTSGTPDPIGFKQVEPKKLARATRNVEAIRTQNSANLEALAEFWSFVLLIEPDNRRIYNEA
jgi:hypothetical protein